MDELCGEPERFCQTCAFFDGVAQCTRTAPLWANTITSRGNSCGGWKAIEPGAERPPVMPRAYLEVAAGPQLFGFSLV